MATSEEFPCPQWFSFFFVALHGIASSNRDSGVRGTGHTCTKMPMDDDDKRQTARLVQISHYGFAYASQGEVDLGLMDQPH